MPQQTPLSRPEIIAFPGDNAELPAKSLERQIYAEPERFQQAMKLGHTILSDIVTENDPKKKIIPDTEEIVSAKNLVRDNLKAILEDEKLRRSIWFDDATEARMENDTEFKRLRNTSPRTESVLTELRFRQFKIFVDSVVEYESSQEKSTRKGLRRTG